MLKNRLEINMKLNIIMLLLFFKCTAVSQNTFNEVIAIELCDKIKKCVTSNLDKKDNVEICLNQFEKEFKEIEKLPPNVQNQFMNFFAANCLEKLASSVVKVDKKEVKKENSHPISNENCEKFFHLEPVTMNVLYEKIDNELEFAAINLDSDSLSIKSTQGKIIKNSKQGLFINGLTPGIVDVEIEQKFKHKKFFKVKELPIPNFSFKEFENYSLSKKDLIKIGEVFGFLLDFDFPIYIKIDSFEIILINKDKNINTFINYGNKISKECTNEIKNLDAGDLIAIKDIEYSYYQRDFNNLNFLKNGVAQNVVYFIEE